VRRPTPLAELAAVAVRAASETVTPAESAVVNDVVAAFSGEGRAFLVVNAQQDVDVSHESFIRKWGRLRTWVEEENRSRRVYAKLADAASSWDRHEASLYRGPELAEARRWWEREAPTRQWANRYHPGFEVARRFLTKSVRAQRVRRGLLFGNVALLILAILAIAVLMTISRAEARRAEAAALEARNATAGANSKLAEANKLFTQAIEAQRLGRSAQADELQRQAQQAEQQASARPVLTPGELSELDRLRKQEAAWQRTEADLRQQLVSRDRAPNPSQQPPRAEATAADLADLERLRKAESSWVRDAAQLELQLTAANDRATKAQQAEAALRRANDGLQARLADAPAGASSADDSSPGIRQLLADYQAAYEKLDAPAVTRLWPSAPAGELARSFSQYRSYTMEIIGPRISVTGDTAVVACVRRMSVEPKVGRRPSPRLVSTVMRLTRSGGSWIIESIDDQQ